MVRLLQLLKNNLPDMKSIKSMTAACILFLMLSCNQKAESSQEETRIKSMDSTSTVVENQTDKLKDQTKKVEASLEKLDQEFKSE
jgi:septal ring factor EnvC (AmiA/AmiB activator)